MGSRNHLDGNITKKRHGKTPLLLLIGCTLMFLGSKIDISSVFSLKETFGILTYHPIPLISAGELINEALPAFVLILCGAGCFIAAFWNSFIRKKDIQ
jgi:hypothetical protein